MVRKIIFYVLGAVLLVLGLVLAQRIAASREKPKVVEEKVITTVFAEKVKNGNVPIVIPANGNLVAKRRLELYAEVQGIFLPGKKLFRDGEKYGRNEVLIKLDDREFYASVQSSKTSLYNLITSVMPDLRLDYPQAYDKWQSYLKNFDLDRTTPELPKFDSDQEKFFINGKDIPGSYFNVKNLEEKLFKYTIRAPFDGILSEASVTEGTLVRTGQKLGEFIDPQVYELEVSISNSFADLLKTGSSVDLSNLDGSKQYIGTVRRVNKIVDLETQTVTAYIDVQGEDLREGMFLEASLQAKEESNALEIDRVILIEGNKLFVVKNEKLELVEIQPVYFTDTKVVVKGLPDGVDYVTRQVPGGYQGMAVKIYQE